MHRILAGSTIDFQDGKTPQDCTGEFRMRMVDVYDSNAIFKILSPDFGRNTVSRDEVSKLRGSLLLQTQSYQKFPFLKLE